MSHDFFTAAVEFKAIETAEAGLFSGYASVFSTQDGHGDVIAPARLM
jgi:hypothetical protein